MLTKSELKPCAIGSALGAAETRPAKAQKPKKKLKKREIFHYWYLIVFLCEIDIQVPSYGSYRS